MYQDKLIAFTHNLRMETGNHWRINHNVIRGITPNIDYWLD
jgi:hypothetical protein